MGDCDSLLCGVIVVEDFYHCKDRITRDLRSIDTMRFLNIIVEDDAVENHDSFYFNVLLQRNDDYYESYPQFNDIVLGVNFHCNMFSDCDDYYSCDDMRIIIRKMVILYDVLLCHAAHSSHSGIRDYVPFLGKNRLYVSADKNFINEGVNHQHNYLRNVNTSNYVVSVINGLYEKFVDDCNSVNSDSFGEDDLALLIIAFMTMFSNHDFSLNTLSDPYYYNTVEPLETLLCVIDKFFYNESSSSYYYHSFDFDLNIVLFSVLDDDNVFFINNVVGHDNSLLKWLFNQKNIELTDINEIVTSVRIMTEKYKGLLGNAGLDTSLLWNYVRGSYPEIMKNHNATYLSKWVKTIFNYPYESLFEYDDCMLSTIDFTTIEFLYRRDFFTIAQSLSEYPYDYKGLDSIVMKLLEYDYLVDTNRLVNELYKSCDRNSIYKLSLTLFTVLLIVERNDYITHNIEDDYDSYIYNIVKTMWCEDDSKLLMIRRNLINLIVLPLVFYFNDPVKINRLIRIIPYIYDYFSYSDYSRNTVFTIISHMLEDDIVFSMIIEGELLVDHMVNIVFPVESNYVESQ